jgi:hypothetical protein
MPMAFLWTPRVTGVIQARYALHSRDIHHDVVPPIYVGLMAQTQLAESFSWSVSCTYCDDDLDHCHGVAVVSETGAMCSEDSDCRVAIELHEFVSFEE